MWLKKFFFFPLRYQFKYLYHLLSQGSWRAEWVGFVWAHLRVGVTRLIEYKGYECRLIDRVPNKRDIWGGKPNDSVPQYD